MGTLFLPLLRSHSLAPSVRVNFPPLRPSRLPKARNFVRRQHTGPSYYTESTPTSPAPVIDPVRPPSILRPALFALAVSATSFLGAAYIANADTERWREKLKAKTGSVVLFGTREPTNAEIQAARRAEFIQRWRQRLSKTLSALGGPRSPLARPAIIVAEWWINLRESQRTCLGVIGINAVVFAAWNVGGQRWARTMMKSFLHHPLSGRSYTLLTSTFSHSSFLHLAFNSVALYSVGSIVMEWLSIRNREVKVDREGKPLRESTSRYHWLAFLVTGGVVSALASHAFALRFRLPRILSALRKPPSSHPRAAEHIPPPILPSLGISGAIYACVTLCALAYPTAQVSLIFLPMFPIPIGVGVWGMVALDVIGLWRGWRMFDHAAHLGGALFGVIYYWVGGDFFDWLRGARRADTLP